ncbi:MAG: SEL1-like repeat protein [Proteobacteria bacterium]|nr:SEL1-like repeat protein [Pseudomonadota bacterium]
MNAYNLHDFPRALRLFLPLAEQGSVEAQRTVGIMYRNGMGVPANFNEALKWYRKAADQGDAAAENNIGSLYESGSGVPQDHAEAAKWFRRAAEKGYGPAQYNLALFYEEGRGVPKSAEDAVAWYRKAADQRQAAAQANLGLMYLNGEGVKQDYVLAYMWITLAATNFPERYRDQVVATRNTFVAKMTPAQVAEAQQLAREWEPGVERKPGAPKPDTEQQVATRSVAEQNRLRFERATATYNRGDLATAQREFSLLAEQNYGDAQFALGNMYFNGQGVALNYTEAIKWYRRAAERGQVSAAQLALGRLYEEGRRVPRDYGEAAQWYLQAANHDDPTGQSALGTLYRNGTGVPKDDFKAYVWLALAASRYPPGEARDRAARERDQVATLLAAGQISEADQQVREWKPGSSNLDTARQVASTNLPERMVIGRSSSQTIEANVATLPPRGTPQARFDAGVEAFGRGDLDAALRDIRSAAEDGLPAAQGQLGNFYRDGAGVPQDFVEAVKWYKRAAVQGNAAAQLSLGRLYEDGRRVRRDLDEAARLYRLSALQDNAAAQAALGSLYLTGEGVKQNNAEAYLWLSLAAARLPAGAERDRAATSRNSAAGKLAEPARAEADRKIAAWKPGDPAKEQQPAASAQSAAREVPVRRTDAAGVPPGGAPKTDTAPAAASPLPPDADTATRFAYATDAYRRRDILNALPQFTALAQAGHVDSQFALGMIYGGGQGGPRDFKQAEKWFRQAAEAGHQGAQLNLAMLYDAGSGGIQRNPAEAVKWYQLAAEQGNGLALYNLGVSYAMGQGVSRDYAAAYRWFAIAAQRLRPGSDRAKAEHNRAEAAKRITVEELAEADRQVQEWKPKTTAN